MFHKSELHVPGTVHPPSSEVDQTNCLLDMQRTFPHKDRFLALLSDLLVISVYLKLVSHKSCI